MHAIVNSSLRRTRIANMEDKVLYDLFFHTYLFL